MLRGLSLPVASPQVLHEYFARPSGYCRLSPVVGPDCLRSPLLNVTARALLELAVAQEQEHALILLDSEGHVVSWQAAAARTLGYTPEEMAGQSLRRIFTPEDIERGDLEWELRTARSYGKAEDDRWHIRKDGVRIWASGVTTALRDRSGQIVGFSKILRDRTDLRSHVETLQGRLDSVVRAEHDTNRLFGTLAHELRGPLAPLAYATQVIRQVAFDEPVIGAAVKIIDRQLGFIENVVKDLLESARVGIGKTKLHYENVALAEIIDKALETCSVALNERNQTTQILLPSPLDLDADPVRLQQVFVNIITNSSKFSPPGSCIWIKGTVDAEALVLRIEDQGKGIPAELLPRIFDLFTQASSEGGSADHGLGLGLGLVKSLIEMHNGTVQARSEGNGKGTEIIVRLPLRQVAALEACL